MIQISNPPVFGIDMLISVPFLCAWLQADSVGCLLLALLLCFALLASPEGLQQQAHCWLLGTVARAPLMLQPLLLLCPPARYAYRQCR